MREIEVNTQTGRRLDCRRTERSREVVGIRTIFRIVGIIQTMRKCVTHQVAKFTVVFARFIIASFVIRLANVGVNRGGTLFNLFRPCRKVQAKSQTIKRSRLIVVNVQIQEVHIGKDILVCTNAKVVPHHRRGKLQQFTRLVIHIGALSVTFDHVIVSRLFLKAANSHVMELGRNARHVGIACTTVKGILRGIRMRNRIPVNLGFVFAVRGVPHHFGTVAKQVTYGHVRNLGAFNHIKGGKAKRSLCGIHHVLGGLVVRVVGICTHNIEVVPRSRLQIAQDNFMLYTSLAIVSRRIQAHIRFASTIIERYRTSIRKLNHYNGRIHAHMTNFNTHTRSDRIVKLSSNEHTCTHKRSRSINTGFRQMVLFPTLSIRIINSRMPLRCKKWVHTTKQSSNRGSVLIGGPRHIFAFGV